MSLENKKISVIKVREEEYLNFCRLLEWRRTGIEQIDSSYYKSIKLESFFKKYNVLNSDTFFVFAAKAEDKYVGYINAVLIPKPDPRLGILYVDELWVPEPYRQEGIGRLLIKAVFKVAKELGLWRVRLYVGTWNDVARDFYKKVGFLKKTIANSVK